MSKWLEGLNPEQREAVEHDAGPMLILAGAGSGKTTVLVARTGRLIDEGDVPASRICVMTFTNKAARELKERLKKKIGASAKGLWAGTFHSFGLQFLKKHHELAELPQGFGVISTSDALALVKELAVNVQVAQKKDFAAEKLLGKIQYLREHGRRPAIQDEYDDMAEVLAPKYTHRLRELGVVDFDDLLLKPISILNENPQLRIEIQEHFIHVMVDEFQDTNEMQMQLIRLISDQRKNLSVVGDDDQSIYGWRGAEVSHILNFPQKYPGNCHVVRLVRNYRSSPEIIELANQVIRRNQNRHEKILLPEAVSQGQTPEVFVFESEDEEIERTCFEIERLRRDEQKNWSDIAILYRSNGQGALFEAEFRQRKWPYKITGSTAFFDRKEIKDAMAYLRCALRPNEVALRRILNAPSRGIGLTTLKKIEGQAKEQGLSFYKSLCRWRNLEISESIGQKIDGFLLFLNQVSGRLLTEGEGVGSPSQKLLTLLEECGYRSHLESTSKNHEAFSKKWMLLEIFARILDSFVHRGGLSRKTLIEFIDAMELRDSDADENQEENPQMNLMTLHASKGLEFPVVFLVGVEEDLLPHRTLGQDVSEERRLFYVGVTRAKERLLLSRVKWRKRYGKLQPCAPSRFLLELPEPTYRLYESGFRPVSEDQRKTQLEDLFAQLDSQMKDQAIGAVNPPKNGGS